MVSKASDDLPDPLTPVTMISLPAGSVTSMFFRLWVRAPRTTSGLRALCGLVASGIPTVANSLGPLKGESYYRAWVCAKRRRVARRSRVACASLKPGDEHRRLGRLGWLATRFQSRKLAGVLHNRPAQRDEQTRDRDDTADVEQRHLPQGPEAHVRIRAQRDCSDCQHDAQFCWAH